MTLQLPRPARCPTNPPEPRHVPRRTCIGCRAVRPPSELVRLAATASGVAVARHAPGRGAWVCDRTCFDHAVRRKGLTRALRTTIDDTQLAGLRESFDAGAARMTESPTGDNDVAVSMPTKG